MKLGILKEYEQGIFSKYVVNSDGYLFSTKFFSPFGEIKITKSKKEISIKYLEIGWLILAKPCIWYMYTRGDICMGCLGKVTWPV